MSSCRSISPDFGENVVLGKNTASTTSAQYLSQCWRKMPPLLQHYSRQKCHVRFYYYQICILASTGLVLFQSYIVHLLDHGGQ